MINGWSKFSWTAYHDLKWNPEEIKGRNYITMNNNNKKKKKVIFYLKAFECKRVEQIYQCSFQRVGQVECYPEFILK